MTIPASHDREQILSHRCVGYHKGRDTYAVLRAVVRRKDGTRGTLWGLCQNHGDDVNWTKVMPRIDVECDGERWGQMG